MYVTQKTECKQMFTPSGKNEHDGFSGSSDMEDEDDVEQQFNAFSQHHEKCSQEEIVQQNGNHFAASL